MVLRPTLLVCSYHIVPAWKSRVQNLLLQIAITNKHNFRDAWYCLNNFSTPQQLKFFKTRYVLLWKRVICIAMHVSLLNTKFFKAHCSFVLDLDFEKDNIVLISASFTEGQKEAFGPVGLWRRHFTLLQVCLTSYPHLHTYKKRYVCCSLCLRLLQSALKQQNRNKMKFCSDAGIIMTTFLKSFTLIPKVQ